MEDEVQSPGTGDEAEACDIAWESWPSCALHVRVGHRESLELLNTSRNGLRHDAPSAAAGRKSVQPAASPLIRSNYRPDHACHCSRTRSGL